MRAERGAESIGRCFAGERDSFAGLPTAVAGSTLLQCEVRAAWRMIRVGAATTCGKLARSPGFNDPRAAR